MMPCMRWKPRNIGNCTEARIRNSGMAVSFSLVAQLVDQLREDNH